jgi:hypothetical protein
MKMFVFRRVKFTCLAEWRILTIMAIVEAIPFKVAGSKFPASEPFAGRP